MTRTCILHIGFPKTGSSAIQQALQGYRDGSIAYSCLRDPNHSSALRALFCRDNSRLGSWLRHQPPERIERHKRRFDEGLSSDLRGMHDLILSAEGIATNLDWDEVGALAERLLGHFDRIRVIAYLRPYQSLAPSGFQQAVKMGESAFLAPAPNLRRRIEKFSHHFGRQAVELALFDRSRLLNGSIVDDFASRIGIDASSLVRTDANSSISLEAVAQMFAHNLFRLAVPTETAFRKQRIGLLRDLAGFGIGRFGFDEAFMAAACARHREDLDWASDVLGVDMAGVWQSVDEPVRDANHLLSIAGRTQRAAREHVANVRKLHHGATSVTQPPSQARHPVYQGLTRLTKFFGLKVARR